MYATAAGITTKLLTMTTGMQKISTLSLKLEILMNQNHLLIIHSQELVISIANQDIGQVLVRFTIIQKTSPKIGVSMTTVKTGTLTTLLLTIVLKSVPSAGIIKMYSTTLDGTQKKLTHKKRYMELTQSLHLLSKKTTHVK